MLSMMVYWDEDKPKVEKSLRSRKRDAPFQEASIGVDMDKLVDLIHKQTDIVDKQNSQIDKLTDALAKALDRPPAEIQTPQPQVIYIDHETKSSNLDTRNPEFELPVLNETLDADVIDTSGIEISGGEVGQNKSEGGDITDHITKLKELKKKKEKME